MILKEEHSMTALTSVPAGEEPCLVSILQRIGLCEPH
jgi:hypothetical protein